MLNWNQHKERTDQTLDSPHTPPSAGTARSSSLPSWWLCGASSLERGARALGSGGGGGARARVLDERAEEGDE